MVPTVRYHRPRSYCGTALHVEVSTIDQGESDVDEGVSSTDQLLVYGRFELHRRHERTDSEDDDSVRLAAELRLGQRVRAADITESSATGGPIWVRGERVQRSDDELELSWDYPASRTTFVLRGSDDDFHHWESDWKSGTSQQHRQTPHHFRVYVFARNERDPQDWQVVGLVTSPPFTFAVYRKYQHDPELLRLKGTESEQRSHQAGQASADGDDEDADSEEICATADGNQGISNPEIVHELVWHGQHRSAAMNTTNIAILVLLAYEGDPAWLAAQSRCLFTLLEAATTAASVPTHLLLHYVNHCVPQLVGLLPRHAERAMAPQPLAPAQYTASTGPAIMQTIADLLCFLLDPALTKPVLAFVSAHACLPTLSKEKRRELLLQWIDMITEHIEMFFQRRGHSTEAFVDDIVSVALRESSGATQRVVREMLRNTRVMGQERFDALLTKLRVDTAAEYQLSTQLASTDDKWTGRWLCRGFARAPVDGRPERRRSWPQATTTRPRLSSGSGPSSTHIGMMTAIAAILSGVGFDLQLCGDQGDVLRVDLLTTVLGEPKFHFSLDHGFRDVSNTLPLEWATLLVVGQAQRRVFCRARTVEVGHDDDNDQLELEFVSFSSDHGEESTWRCLLRFEVPSVRAINGFLAPLSSLQRRRLILHVRVDKAQPIKQPLMNHGSDDDGSGDSDKDETVNSHNRSEGGSSTESDAPSSNRVVADNEKENGGDVPPIDDAAGLYSRVLRWHTRFAIQGTYYALE